MDDRVLRVLDIAQNLGAEYADARLITKEYEQIESKNLEISAINRGTSEGIGVRILVKGGWGFASTSDLSRDAIEMAVRRAAAVARASSGIMKNPVKLAPEPVYDVFWESPYSIDPFKISLEEKSAILLSAAKNILAVKGISLASGHMDFVKEMKEFGSTEGSRITQLLIRSGCGIEANATSDTERQRRSYPKHVGQYELAGFEMVQKWNLPDNAQRIAEEAVALLSAEQCPQGKTDVILGSSQLGLQIHESCGHPSELDRALGQEINFAGASFLTPEKLGKLRYGSDKVNLVADATASGALGSFGYDDEGVKAHKIYLVKEGLFSGYLSSRDTAQSIGLNRSGGCMRANSWGYAPIIRMTNISVEPGNAGSLDDLIANTQDGILMETNKSWSIDSMRYNFQFSTEIGWEIKDGKKGRMLKNPSYSGITPEFWNSCDAICDISEFTYWGEPNCGKGQPMQLMWTGHGASPGRFKNVQVGIARK